MSKVVVCPRCEARNTAGGQCILCGVQLGSLPRALAAASVAALLLAGAWGVWFWLTGVVALWFALLFGIVVSGAVVQVSFGRGWLFQAIASAATVGGIILGEALMIWLFGASPQAVWQDQWWLAFSVLGLMGGMWVWKQPSSSEDA